MTQQTPNTNNQKELAAHYTTEIEEYIKILEPITTKREQILTSINRLTIASIVLPIILAPLTSITTLLLQEFWIALINIANVLPPILASHNKNKLEKYNNCTDLKLNLTNFKGDINRLAIAGELKGKTKEE
ncbi:MAG: hypothetical protein LBE76_00770 [Nitrososphaerota archaeon]|nr:hypothetical protein [Nitrososphaerota archaeon]